MEPQSDAIDRWGIVSMYCRACENESWIEAISLGYTLVEMQLTYLMKSKARPTRQPLADTEIRKCRYLLQRAQLAHREGFLPEAIVHDIEKFNDRRISAIHRLLDENTTLDELKDAANQASMIYGKIQDLWLPVRIGDEEVKPSS